MNANRRSPYIAHRELANGSHARADLASIRASSQRAYHNSHSAIVARSHARRAAARTVYIAGARAGYWAAAAATFVIAAAWCAA